MNATAWALCPFSWKVNKSLCQSWLGVARSKNRGLGRFRRRFCCGGGNGTAAWCSVRLTVSGLAGRKSDRCSHCAIRRTPKAG